MKIRKWACTGWWGEEKGHTQNCSFGAQLPSWSCQPCSLWSYQMLLSPGPALSRRQNLWDQSESCPPGLESAIAQVEGDCGWGPHDTVQRGGHECLMILSRLGPELPWVCYFWSLDAQLFHLIQRMTQSPSKRTSSPAHDLDDIQFNTRCVIDDFLGHQMLHQILSNV